MSKNPSETPKKIMTVCRVASAYRDVSLGLLFVERGGLRLDEAEVQRIMFSPEVETHFNTTFLGFRVGTDGDETWRTSLTAIPEKNCTGEGLLLTTDVRPYVYARPHVHTAFVYIRHGDTLSRTPVGDFIDRCWMLTKAVGCHKCPLQGAKCFWTNLEEEIPVIQRRSLGAQPLLPGIAETLRFLPRGTVNNDAFRELLEENSLFWDPDDRTFVNWKTTVAGYTFIPPTITARNLMVPGTERLRLPSHHQFKSLEANRQAASDRSQAGVETRRTLRTECSQCCLASVRGKSITPCAKYRPRHCVHGAWTEKRLVDYTLEHLQRRLDGTCFGFEDLWRVAHVAGMPFKMKNPATGRSVEVTVRRLGETYGGGNTTGAGGHPFVLLSRTAKRIEEEEDCRRIIESPYDLRDMLPPNVRRVWDDPGPFDAKLLALWTHVAVTPQSRSYNCVGGYGYMQYQPATGTVSISGGYPPRVDLELWLSRENRYHSFESFDGLLAFYDELPFFNIWEKENDQPRSLNCRVR